MEAQAGNYHLELEGGDGEEKAGLSGGYSACIGASQAQKEEKYIDQYHGKIHVGEIQVAMLSSHVRLQRGNK